VIRNNAIVAGVVTIGGILLVTGAYLLWPRAGDKMLEAPANTEVASTDAGAPDRELRPNKNAGSRLIAQHEKMPDMLPTPMAKPTPLAGGEDEEPPGVPANVIPRPQDEVLKERLLLSLRSSRDSMALTPDEKAALKKLSEDGVNIVDVLMAEYRSPEPPEVTLVVRNQMILQALAAVKTTDAQASLLKIAMSEETEHPSLPVRAAMAYIQSGVTGANKAKLLESQNLNVKLVATKAVKGDELSGDMVRGVSDLLEKANFVQARCDAAATLAADPGRRYSGAKVTAIAEAIAQEEKREGARNPTYGTVWTERELALVRYAHALTTMTGATQAIREQARGSQGDLESVLIAALAGRGEAAVHSDVMRKIRDSRDGVIRTVLVGSLGEIAAPGDIGFLKTLAESDRFKRRNQSGQDVYPVREAARRVLAKLSER